MVKKDYLKEYTFIVKTLKDESKTNEELDKEYGSALLESLEELSNAGYLYEEGGKIFLTEKGTSAEVNDQFVKLVNKKKTNIFTGFKKLFSKIKFSKIPHWKGSKYIICFVLVCFIAIPFFIFFANKDNKTVPNKMLNLNQFLATNEFRNGSDEFKVFLKEYREFERVYNVFDLNKFANKSFSANKEKIYTMTIGDTSCIYLDDTLVAKYLDYEMTIEYNSLYYHVIVFELEKSQIYDYQLSEGELTFIADSGTYILNRDSENYIFRNSFTFNDMSFKEETYVHKTNKFLYHSGYQDAFKSEYILGDLNDLDIFLEDDGLLYKGTKYEKTRYDEFGKVIYTVLENKYLFALKGFSFL
jgi:hypothetical protein